MVELDGRPQLGPYVLTRRLADGPLGERHLAVHRDDLTSHIVHRPPMGSDGPGQQSFVNAVRSLDSFDHPHALKAQQWAVDSRGRPWAATAYTGDVMGIETLEGLLKTKGGYFSPSEARQALIHLLELASAAHNLGVSHGPMTMAEVHVDRRGSLMVEFYGIARSLGIKPRLSLADAQAAEVLSIIQIGYQLVTGLVPEPPYIPVTRVVPEADPAWDDWFEVGLVSPATGGPGFRSAAHALSALTDRAELQLSGIGRVKVALSRLLGAAR